MAKLTKRVVDDLTPGDAQKFVWDGELRGFGVRIQPSGVKSYVLQYRSDANRSRRMVLGRHSVLTVDEARIKARKLLAIVSDGADPMGDKNALRDVLTVNEFLDRHLEEHVETHNGPRTAKDARYMFDRFARPALGALKITAVTRQDVEKLHLRMKATPVQANRLLALLSKAFSNAEGWGLRPENANPCRKIRRYREKARERFLSDAELKRVGATLRLAATAGLPWEPAEDRPPSKHLVKPENRRNVIAPEAINLIHLLLLTGARLGELRALEWAHVDFGAQTLALPGKKGGDRRAHPMGELAGALLATIDRKEGSPWVFYRPADPSRHISQEVVENAWQRLRAHAKLTDVHLHDLRHTFGTFAGQTGANAFLVRDLLRHRTIATTDRYANKDADPMRVASDVIGARIAAGLSEDAAAKAPEVI